ncbi:hypothetical protein JAAARDRAFT_34361 [Jaapia argillacea MUCL 33604]|uniref:Transmembrane protein n=1 Tax=Jaapia argillacea MUCL 33604 TaxID=933084 RepID=A0A067PXD5_9AGAM|nr:hypothetical protein JAAARDRAFT_34361 [Jaapia argillacea MUCL 33604]
MVDWQSPAEIAKDAAVFDKFMHALLGLYIWEFFTSLSFDLQYLTGKRKFRWPLVFYFGNRYALLGAMIGIAIALNVAGPVNCQALYTFNQVCGNVAIGMASINLSIRTMAVWSQKWYIVGPLIAIILGHWSLLLHGILLKAVYIPGEGCVITSTSNTVLAGTFIYSMAFDFVVLTLTATKMAFPVGGRSKLFNMIFQDGLIYFIVAFLANLLATIFILLNLNPVMSVIVNVPAAIASTIVATRIVRRLSNFTSQGAEMFSSTQGSTLAFRSGATTRQAGTVSFKKSQTDGVHLQMDTFTVGDRSGGSFMEYDAAGKVVKSGHLDPEAQVISEEFKRPPY